MDEEKVATLAEPELVVTEKVLAKFSPAERDTIERYQRELLALMRAGVLGDNP